jgi:hypothetical protein
MRAFESIICDENERVEEKRGALSMPDRDRCQEILSALMRVTACVRDTQQRVRAVIE